MVNYIGNYDYYIEHVDERMTGIFGTTQTGSGAIGSAGRSAGSASDAAVSGQTSNPAGSTSSGSMDYKAQKEEKARRKKIEAALKKCEEDIARLEKRDGEITEKLSDPAVGSDLAQLRKLTDEQTEIQEKLSTLYDEWEELAQST